MRFHEPAPYLGWKPCENSTFSNDLYSYQVGSFGERLDPTLNESGSSAPEIIFVGCSQTFGTGVACDATFSSTVARETKANTLNLAVSGYSTVQSLRRAEEYFRLAGDRRPRVLIYGLWFDHLKRNVEPYLENDWMVSPQRPSVIRDGSAFRIREARSNPLAFRRWTAVSRGSVNEPFIRYRSWLTLRLAGDLDRSIASAWVTEHLLSAQVFHRTRVIILWIPNYLKMNELKMAPIPAPLQGKLSEISNLEIVDVTKSFGKYQFKDLVAAEGRDHHMSTKAHQICAESLLTIL